MIEFVYGAKGSGKTKKMIDMANNAVETCNGDIIFINDRDKYRATVDTKIRFINLEEFEVHGTDQLFGFLNGVIAENYDVKLIVLDNLLRIIEAKTPDDVCNVIERITKVQEKHSIKFILSLSIDESELPACVKQLIN